MSSLHKIPPPPPRPLPPKARELNNSLGKPQGPSNEVITLPKSLTYVFWLCIFGVVFVVGGTLGWSLGLCTAAIIN